MRGTRATATRCGPEYVLTRSGEVAARRCAKLLESVDEDEVLLRKWSLPILAALTQPARFSELRAALPGVTPRALALALKDLQGARPRRAPHRGRLSAAEPLLGNPVRPQAATDRRVMRLQSVFA